MISIDQRLTPRDLMAPIRRMWDLSAAKLDSIDRAYDPVRGTPVFTVAGTYTARGWTEWTQGFQFGSALLQFDATGDPAFLEMGRSRTLALMAPHITHVGVHDHGFNNVSTYGNLLRLWHEGRTGGDPWERHFHELALKCTGAVQAARWTRIRDGGFIHSFNGPHSLFVDTMRTLRALSVSHHLGHALMGENDRKISLLDRVIQHARATALHFVYYGQDRDRYDVRGRCSHEALFNVTDGNYRCPGTQQGYSPFSTWTRGLAWAMLGFAEQLEWFRDVPDADFEAEGGRSAVQAMFLEAARATCDFYLSHTPTNGIPYWDTGAPGLHKLGDYLNSPAEPFNDHEPVDASAAAIAAQGLLRLGRHLGEEGVNYVQAGLTVVRTLLAEPYLSESTVHQGLLLHSVYHRPNGWDYIPEARKVPCGESSMWGDYHLRELALYVQRLADSGRYLKFWP